MNIALIGAPVGTGAGITGCAMGPAALRTVGLAATLEELGHRVTDFDDIRPAAVAELSPQGKARTVSEIAGFARALSAKTYEVLRSGQVPVILGGDHSVSMGSVSGIARACAENGRDLFVLWLDAHADFNTPETSPSGNMHGMSLAMLAGEPGLDDILPAQERFRVPPSNIHLFGIRSVDRDERRLLAERGVNVVDMRRIDEFGVVNPLQHIIDEVTRHDGLLHVSLDIDFLDPSVSAAVGTPVPGGATYREAHLIMEMLHDSGRVCSLDIVELNPILDERGKGARVLVDLVASLFGRSIMERHLS